MSLASLMPKLDSTIKFDGTSWPKLADLTGIAVGKLSIPSSPEQQLVLTTLGGDQVIIDIHKSGSTVSLGALSRSEVNEPGRVHFKRAGQGAL